MQTTFNLAVLTLTFAGCVTTTLAETLFSDNFDDNKLTGWGNLPGYACCISETNQQLQLAGNFTWPLDPANIATTHIPAYRSLSIPGALGDQQTLELRVDLVSANQDEAWAGISFTWNSESKGYMLFVDRDDVYLGKFYSGSYAAFVYEHPSLPAQNVALTLSFTRDGSNLRIQARVLDKANNNAILFACAFTDTPQADPVLSETIMGIPPAQDPVGTPWPIQTNPSNIGLVMQWADTENGPAPLTQVIYDNVEVRRYASPQLAIENAVILSWPTIPGEFILETATVLSGPWTRVSDPWWRTNAGRYEVSIPAPESVKLFRLR